MVNQLNYAQDGTFKFCGLPPNGHNINTAIGKTLKEKKLLLIGVCLTPPNQSV